MVCMSSARHAEFEMDRFRQKMDEQGIAVAENQESSLKSRRRLAETTRGDPEKASARFVTVYPPDFWILRLVFLPTEFKKGASADLNRDVGTLLKAYQEEVDRLTTRYYSLSLLGIQQFQLFQSSFNFNVRPSCVLTQWFQTFCFPFISCTASPHCGKNAWLRACICQCTLLWHTQQ